jgi:hypothetical protein
MLDPQYLRDYDKHFLYNCKWQRKIAMLPCRLFDTGKTVWLKPVFKATLTFRVDVDFVDESRYYSEEFALWHFLTNGD